MLKKSTLREIKTSIARYLAIFAIVALGVGFFAGLKDCKPSMVKMASDYLEEHNFYDYQIASSYGIDDESIEIAEGWEGVSGAEGSLQIDVMAKAGDGDSRALRAISLPENINTLSVVTGRLPENENECVIDDYSYSEDGYTNGDKIILTDENDKDKLKQFRSDEFTIVGTVTTPIFLDYQRGSTDIGNGSLDTFFYIQKEAFDEDYYSALYVTLEGDEEPFSEELDDKLESVSGSMDDLADRVNDARRETARKEAQEKLDKKKKDYEDKLADYEKEKADAEKKIRDARNQINSGEKTIAGTRKEIKAQIKDLKGKKKQVEKGISSAGAIAEGKASGEREKLKTAHEAGLISDEEYKAGMAAIDKQVASGTKKAVKKLKKQLKQINNGISKAEKGLKTLDSKEKDLNKNRKTLDREQRKADREFADAQKKLDEAKEKLDEAQEKIDDMETGNSYAFSRNDNAGYSSFDSNSSIVSNIARIFPVFFFLIAALVCMTTMTRMVEEQRTQIGVLKALGYSNSQIVAKYMFYSGSAAFLGACVGFFAGCKVFPTVIWNAYTMMYSFSPTVDYVIDPVLGIISLSAALVCSMGATWISIAQDFRVSPSELIRPKTPPAGKRILLERVTPLWKRISFLYKVSIRNIFRDKKRFLMMVIGVSGCTALLIAGLGIRTTIAKVADHQ
ncbi:MAG: FtsX-like permease family protein, partial [Clostridiales bacterium]|nr:FtsX-like permease family protein [Clostridiales bacterium]